MICNLGNDDNNLKFGFVSQVTKDVAIKAVFVLNSTMRNLIHRFNGITENPWLISAPRSQSFPFFPSNNACISRKGSWCHCSQSFPWQKSTSKLQRYAINKNRYVDQLSRFSGKSTKQCKVQSDLAIPLNATRNAYVNYAIASATVYSPQLEHVLCSQFKNSNESIRAQPTLQMGNVPLHNNRKNHFQFSTWTCAVWNSINMPLNSNFAHTIRRLPCESFCVIQTIWCIRCAKVEH